MYGVLLGKLNILLNTLMLERYPFIGRGSSPLYKFYIMVLEGNHVGQMYEVNRLLFSKFSYLPNGPVVYQSHGCS